MSDAKPTDQLMEKLVLGEIEGKNRAIHAHDSIVWKIRSGFLTLVFGGWAILLQGIAQDLQRSPETYRPFAWGLYLFTLGFALGAWYVDRSYVRRKFRVIVALDRLTDEIRACNGDFIRIPPELLKVAGDSGEMPYKSTGYREASRAELSVYLAPVAIVLGVVVVLL